MIENEKAILANSLWSDSSNETVPVECMLSTERVDIAVIGGGYSGVSTALHCADYGLDVCLIEKETIGWGASGRNGGQVIPGLKELPETIFSSFGLEMGKKIVNLAGNAPDYVFKLIRENEIDCGAAQNGWINASWGKRGLMSNENVFRQWVSQSAPVELLSAREVCSLIGSDTYSGGVVDFRGGKLHPLNYILGLGKTAQKKGVKIYQKSPVLGIDRYNGLNRIHCPGGLIMADRVVLATNGYGQRDTGTANKNVIAVQSVQVASSPLSDNVLKTILPQGHVVSDTRRLLNYFRIANDGRLLMGGRGGSTNASTLKQIKELKFLARAIFPQIGDIDFKHVWGGNVALTLDHFPQICMLENDIISLSGYNGRGVALATVLGKVVADFLKGVASEELEFPITSLTAIPFPKFQQSAIPVVAWYKKILDRMD